MNEINKVLVTEPVGCGATIIENMLGLGVDVIATSDILKNT
jgi:CxxC motif-containing protein